MESAAAPAPSRSRANCSGLKFDRIKPRRRSFLQLGNDRHGFAALLLQRPPKAARDMLSRPPLQFAQIRRKPGFSQSAACCGHDVVKAGRQGNPEIIREPGYGPCKQSVTSL